jgi:hypothetical protein
MEKLKNMSWTITTKNFSLKVDEEARYEDVIALKIQNGKYIKRINCTIKDGIVLDEDENELFTLDGTVLGKDSTFQKLLNA